MRIVIACPSRARFHILSEQSVGLGGVETACIELATALAARGHAVTLLSPTDEPQSVGGVKNVGLDAIGRINDDVLILANDATLFRRSHYPWNVMWIHNPLALEKAVRKGHMVPIIRHRPHAVFVGPLAEQVCSRLYPFASRNAIPLGISRPFLSSRLDRSRSPIFVWASQPQRGLKQTVQAWLRAVPCMPGASFHIFDAGPEWTGLTDAQIRDASIVLHPRRTKANLAAFYETASAMIYPGALDETFCLAAAEAQCAGLPVITLGIGSLSERVQHGTNGLICRHMNDLSETIIAVFKDPGLLAHLREGALAQRPLMTWARVATLWESLLMRLRDQHAGERTVNRT
jgi:glycosyltransferase involved in cell wall biosynthesis